MKKYFRLNTILLPLISAPVLTGCSQSVDDLYTYIDQAKSAHVGSVKPIPQFKPYESFTYSASELRDPFEAAMEIEEEDDKEDLLSPDKTRPRQPLEAFPLDTLRMVGSIAREGSLYGLVQDPDGLIHRILPGNYLGQNDGRVTDISDGEIALVEIVPDGVGGYVERPAGLALSE